MIVRLTALVRILLGVVCLVNGFNWFFKIITPYPSISDFVHYMPPPDIVGAMIEQGVLFHLAKATEVATGIALLANRLVPLSLVIAMPVTVTVFLVDVFKPEFRLRAFLMGTGSLTMNLALLMAYQHHYRAMLAWRARPAEPGEADPPAEGGALAEAADALSRALLPALLAISALLGLVMTGWLAVMIAQYAADPKAIYEVRHMMPRP